MLIAAVASIKRNQRKAMIHANKEVLGFSRGHRRGRYDDRKPVHDHQDITRHQGNAAEPT